MSQEKNIGIAEELLAGIGEGKDPDVIAALFSENVVFEIPGDDGVLPWIGRNTGRGAVTDFIRGIRSMTEPVKFDIQDVLASDARAVIVGELATRIKATGRVIESAIAIILTVSEGEVTRFQMLEDSFGVSRAARV
jgi:ketosteroid isomerase-like protein